MKQLALFLLRLLLQLVLFGITGRWVELGKDARTLQPRSVRNKQGTQQRKKQAAARPGGTFSAERKPARARASRAPMQSPSFADEGTYRDPESAVLEGGFRHAVRGRAVRTASRRPAPTSLRAALSDPRMVRDALTLGAALGTGSGARPRRR